MRERRRECPRVLFDDAVESEDDVEKRCWRGEGGGVANEVGRVITAEKKRQGSG